MGVIPKGIPRGCQGLFTPVSLGYPLSVFNKNSTLTHTRVEPQPHMPYVIFRNMSPHFDSYANSGIPDIKGTEYQLHRWDDHRRCQLLHLLPHLQLIDVGTCMEHRIGDLQTLTTAIMLRTGKRPLFHPNHSTTHRLTDMTEDSLQHEKLQFGLTAECVIRILCNTDLPDILTAQGYKASATDYLGNPRIDGNGAVWRNLNSSESGWGNLFGIISQVCKSWHKVAQRRRSNPSHITVFQREGDVIDGEINGVRILREIKTSHKPYTKLHSIYVGRGSISNKTQVHEFINILCDLTPTLQKLHMPGTDTENGLRAANSLAIRGLGLRDSI